MGSRGLRAAAEAPGRGSERRRPPRAGPGSGRGSGLGPAATVPDRWAASSVPVLQMGKLWPPEANELTQDPVEGGSPLPSPADLRSFFRGPETESCLRSCSARRGRGPGLRGGDAGGADRGPALQAEARR